MKAQEAPATPEPVVASNGVVLRPCPFCGASGDLLSIASVKDQHGCMFDAVRCGGCLCDGPMALSEKTAIAQWNDRYDSLTNLDKRVSGQNPTGQDRPTERTVNDD